MRAAFSLLSLVIVAAIVLVLAKKQVTALKPAEPVRALLSSGGVGVLDHIPTGIERAVVDEVFAPDAVDARLHVTG